MDDFLLDEVFARFDPEGSGKVTCKGDALEWSPCRGGHFTCPFSQSAHQSRRVENQPRYKPVPPFLLLFLLREACTHLEPQGRPARYCVVVC